MSDKHLERKEVLNLVYTQQADRMADAYARLMADFSQTTAWGRGLESDLSWARSELMQVKSEVELWKLRSDNWQKFCQLTRPEMTDELNRLKAEVERLAMAGSQSIAIGIKMREMVGDHHWSMEFDRVRTDWYHAMNDALCSRSVTNTPPKAV